MVTTRLPYFGPRANWVIEKRIGGPFDPVTKLQLRNLWTSIVKQSEMQERIRQNLSVRPFFSKFNAFKTFDSFNKGFITKDEVIKKKFIFR
jgi:hypothetical protein